MRLHFFEETAQTGQRPAGADTHHDRVEVMAHLLPNLRPGSALVRERIGRIAELINVEAARNFLGQARRDVLIIFRVTAGDVRARHPHLGAERAHVGDFFLRHLVGNNENAAVAFGAGDQSQAETGIAGSRLDDRAARLQFSIAFRRLDHRESDAILDRAGRILVLEFKKKLARAGVHPRDFHQRRVADERKNRGRFVARHRRHSGKFDHGVNRLRISFG